MKTIKVLGKGNVSCPPDAVILSFEIECKSYEYAHCLKELNARTDDLRKCMKAASTDRASLKTTSFNVRADTKYENGSYTYIGYIASHRLQIELPMDTTLLNCVSREIARGHSGAEINIAFTVKDKETLRMRVLADAVRVAKSNASALAEAAGVKLGELQQIDYGWAEVRIYEQESRIPCMAMGPGGDPDIEPEDVRADDTVTLVYTIQG